MLKQRPPWLAVKIAAAIATAAFFDSVTAVECDVSALYVAAVIYAAWHGRLKYGVLCMALSIAVMSTICAIQGTPFSNRFYLYIHLLNVSLIMAALTFAVSWYRKTLDVAIRNSKTDPLTSIANRRTLMERIDLEIKRSKRTGSAFAFAYIDLDNFKTINDKQGHDAGDAVLVETADTINKLLRSTDLAARVGGDEFCVLVPDCSQSESSTIIHRLRKALETTMAQHDWPVTFSIGLVAYAEAPDTAEQVIADADRLMYAAKHGGKNNTVHNIE
ncbi:GGDEF domain-containing protein [Telmatospirillum sp.]|uniref:GGDEF domain-containing protein n=1 Tax=Telmatospirillum sp. TaxID=2079197 RepID=UPI002845B143|nr:GGDEF domain-containing protein [Telmatospirillum sp.]MDR3440053.1 GGDEF domain-containing protein [Telmatospirillum sp.]